MKVGLFASEGYAGVTHAGIALTNGTEVFLAQRTMDETDAPDVQETWEFPGGGLEPGEQPFEGAVREFLEETGLTLPENAVVTNGWRSDDGVYQCFVMTCPVVGVTAAVMEGWQPTSECQAVGWFTRETMPENLRPEVRDGTPWDLIFGNEDGMTEQSTNEAAAEPDYSDIGAFDFAPLPIHGVVAPEELATGDKRKFAAGAMTKRPLRLPFSDQKVAIGGHDGSVVVGSVDRLMRKDGLVHWEGSLMPSAESDDLVGRMEFFGGRFGVSVDGDAGSLDTERSHAEDTLVFDKIRASGLTAVAIPAFHEAYVAFGPHPEMPSDNEGDETLAASMYDEGDLIGGQAFKRGPGWVTDPKATNRIHDYWTKKGQPGYAKVAWGTPGDFARAKALIGAKIAEHSPDKMRFLNQIIAQWHFDALGYWPATHAKMDRASKAAVSGNETFAEESEEVPDLYADYEAAIEESDAIETDDAGQGWEVVLVSSAGGGRVTPPASYFDYQPDSGALVIEEPDENGIRRTYGYAGEWGVCHIGIDGRCVEVPEDESGDFPYFHLGRTKTDGGVLSTGVVTYKVDHRGREQILTETAEQQHFDNIAHAWAAVRLGTDDRGIWFAGYVLPTVPEEDIVLIEAAGQVSGEWKRGDLRALQAVNVPGFAVLRDEDGAIDTMVASTFGNTISECEPTPEERMAALRQADAEARFEAARAEFNWVDVAESLVAEAQDSGRVEPIGLRDDGTIVYELDGEVPGMDTIVEPMPEGTA